MDVHNNGRLRVKLDGVIVFAVRCNLKHLSRFYCRYKQTLVATKPSL
jgi:hypothetical protein